MALPSSDECIPSNSPHKKNDAKVLKRSWSNLPSELLLLIADRLGLIDLLSLRGVCKEWRAASSSASAQIESAPGAKPYFLLHTDDVKCALYDQKEEKSYIINIPELKEATCLASNQGWLLLFQEGSVFFFCPFSSARIDLPKFPHSEISDHIAAFSAPPTSPDCVVSIMNRCDKVKMELNVLRRGDDTWTKHEYIRNEYRFGPVICATYSHGTFYYVDNRQRAVTFSVKQKSWVPYVIVESRDSNPLPFSYGETYPSNKDLRKWMRLDEDVSISTCGAVLPRSKYEYLICRENLKGRNGSDGGRELKGLWIQPRVYQIPPNQTW